MPPELGTRVDELVQSAEKAGFSGARLAAKAREGVAKGIPAERILVVLASMRAQMDQAAAIIDRAHSKRLSRAERRGLVGVIGQAFASGISAEMVTSLTHTVLRDEGEPKTLEAAVVALTDLTMQGYPKAEAHILVELGIEYGLTAADFPALVKAVNRLGERGDRLTALHALQRALKSQERLDWVNSRGPHSEAGPPPWAGKGKGRPKPKGP